MSRVPNAASAVVRQLHEWAQGAGYMLFPRVVQMPVFPGSFNSATKSITPDGGMLVVGLVGMENIVVGVDKVLVANIQTGSRKLVESGGLRLSSFLDGLEYDGGTGYLCAPIGVVTGNVLQIELACEDPGDTFGDGNATAATAITLVGYGIHDLRTGAQVQEDVATRAIMSALEACGEFRCMGLSGGPALAIKATSSATEPFTAEIVAMQRMRPAFSTSCQLLFGLYDVAPMKLSASEGLQLIAAALPAKVRAPSVVLTKGTKVELRISGTATMRASVAIHGRRMS